MKQNYYSKSLYQKYSRVYLDMGLKNQCMHSCLQSSKALEKTEANEPVQTENKTTPYEIEATQGQKSML